MERVEYLPMPGSVAGGKPPFSQAVLVGPVLYLSGSIGVLGMGRFELDLTNRRRGLMVVKHFDSPAVVMYAGDEPSCALLEGLHAGLLSHLAGRRLSGQELSCSRSPQEPCRFVVGTEARLQKLVNPAPGSSDADLLLSLGVRPPVRG